VYNENPTCKLLGESVKITEASEPTDIIWENRHYTEGLRNMKRLIVYLVIICVLGVAAWMIYTFSILSQKAAQKYPEVQCEDYEKHYLLYEPAVWQEEAVEEFYVNELNLE